ncbi:MAG: NAD(+) synthase [Firmicutes bacterium]|jgi:NAD+ synthase (glutamine-hydrolysing)|nr:NAD(+) synthase [Bacillota bacterium]
MHNFFNFYRHGFIRVAAAVPQVRVADPASNAAEILQLARRAAAEHAILAVFPGLHLSAGSNEDLFHQQALLEATVAATTEIMRETAGLNTVFVLGAPLVVDSFLFNCALILQHGQLLGIVPQTYLPSSRTRQFRPSAAINRAAVDFCGQRNIPFGTDLLFTAKNIPHFTFAIELGEDLFVPVPPSASAALAGATVLVNPAASPASAGSADCRRTIIAAHATRCLAAYLYVSAGYGESTTDFTWDGHALIYESSELLAETERFHQHSRLLCAEIDLERLAQERLHCHTFAENARLQAAAGRFRQVEFTVRLPETQLLLSRTIPRFPYIPAAPDKRQEHFRDIYNMQIQGLTQRLRASGREKVVLGVSGGLDSAQALVIAAKAMDHLGLPREHVRAYTMPGFATSDKTRKNAWRLVKALGVFGEEIDIRPASSQLLVDIGHPAGRGEAVYDVTFENVQAGQRTATLFRLANLHGGLVLGTGDMSELALGWTTYGVGDHMSHYNVNAGIPKTLLQQLLRWEADTGAAGKSAAQVLLDILDTDISPELIPGRVDGSEPAQLTEEIIGPYELHDFFLYYTSLFGFRPSKVAYLAYTAWHDKSSGSWHGLPEEKRRHYTLNQIKHWLKVFLRRFYAVSQFKRSAAPDGPMVGPGSLSPRSGWRAPSDASAAPWMVEVERIPDSPEAD